MRFDWRAKAAELITRVDPHNADRPVYILTAQEAASAVAMPECLGCFGPLMTYRLRPIIDRHVGFEGPGFCCIVDRERLPVHYQLEGVVLHEFAHDVEAGDSTEELLQLCPDPVALTAPPAEPMDANAVSPRRPWEGHEAGFIRLCIHLAYRARIADGWMGDVNDLVGETFPLSRGTSYAEALGDEPRRLIDRPLSAIRLIEPPAEFRRFADADLQEAEARFEMLLHWRRPR